MVFASPVVRSAMVIVSTLAVAGAPAVAHDFWIRPSTFTPAVGGEIAVALEIGHAGESEGYARNPARIEQFVIAGPGADGAVRDFESFKPSAAFAGLQVYFDAYTFSFSPWSPDGSRIVYGADDGVYVLDVAAGRAFRAADGALGVWVGGK